MTNLKPQITVVANQDDFSHTKDIVCAYVSKNPLSTSDLTGLIRSVFGAVIGLRTPEPEPVPAPALIPAVSIRKSITHEALYSLEDGKAYKSLKRHLSLRGLTPEAYRAKWHLPVDYPMTAAGYSERRSALAKSIGLGRKPGAKVARSGASRH